MKSHEPIEVVWNKRTDQGYQPIPSLFSVEPNRLVLHRATPAAAGTYQVIVRNSHGQDQQELTINVEPRRGRQDVVNKLEHHKFVFNKINMKLVMVVQSMLYQIFM